MFTHSAQALPEPEQVLLWLGKCRENRLAGKGDHEFAQLGAG
jgi:hypothetical protein